MHQRTSAQSEWIYKLKIAFCSAEIGWPAMSSVYHCHLAAVFK